MQRNRTRLSWLAVGVLTVALLGCGARAAWAQVPSQREVFFGETHVHTSWSFDAYIFGNHITGPQDYYGDRSPEQVANVFGAKFARSLFQLQPGSWHGPIESGFGRHLVWVESMTPARVPAIEEVEPEVRSAWVAEQRTEIKRQAFEAMRARYEVVLSNARATDAAGGGRVPAEADPAAPTKGTR